MPSHDAHIRRILDQLGSGVPVSQRSLSGELGIALGLTNLLVRRMMQKGWVQLVRVPPNRYRYFLTPAGLAEKARRSRAYFAHSVQFYAQTRDRIRRTFDAMSVGWESIGGPEPKQVVFFTAGEIAEIGYVCLQDTDLRLIGVVDDARSGAFFGVPVQPVSALKGTEVAGQPFGAVVVMSLADSAQAQMLLEARGVPASRVIWLA
ncbi:MAG TPA: winged helix-turn-helix transcriptional regulator [Vicinamibacterales bacterium]